LNPSLRSVATADRHARIKSRTCLRRGEPVSESQPAGYVLIILTGDAIIFRFDYETFVPRVALLGQTGDADPIADPEATLK
jgi:hypothetical protein